MTARLMAASCLVLGFAALALSAQDATKPLWLEDYKQAMAAAREADKPVFMVFRCVT